MWIELGAVNGPYKERGKYMVDYTRHVVAAHHYEHGARKYEAEHSGPRSEKMEVFKEEYISELAERSRKAQDYAQKEHIWQVIQWGERHISGFGNKRPPATKVLVSHQQ